LNFGFEAAVCGRLETEVRRRRSLAAPIGGL